MPLPATGVDFAPPASVMVMTPLGKTTAASSVSSCCKAARSDSADAEARLSGVGSAARCSAVSSANCAE